MSFFPILLHAVDTLINSCVAPHCRTVGIPFCILCKWHPWSWSPGKPWLLGSHIIRVLNCKQQDRRLANTKKGIYWKEIDQCTRSAGRLEKQTWNHRRPGSRQQPEPVPARSCLLSFPTRSYRCHCAHGADAV